MSVIDHPAHYSGENYECIDVMVDWFGKQATADFCHLNAFKYLCRAGKKGTKKDMIDDLGKARWYIDYEIMLRKDMDE